MKPRRIFFAARLSLPLATALVALLSAPAARAGSATWNQTAAATYTWGTNANWSPNTTFPNATGDFANINNDIAGNIIISLASGSAANRTVGDLNLGDSSGTSTFTIQPGVAGSLLIFGGARTMDVTGAGANTISAGIRASGGNLTFRSTATAETTISLGIESDGTNRSLTFNNDINGTATAAASGQGQFAITAATTLRGTTGTLGTTTINDVRVRGTVANAFGSVAGNTVTVAGAGQLYLPGGTHANNLVLNSSGWQETAGNFGALRIENATVNGTVTLQQNAIIGVNANNTGTLNGVISGNFGITKVGGTGTSAQGQLSLSGANTFTGPVTVERGTIAASNAAALGTNAVVTVNASPTTGGDGNRLAISGTITIGAGKTLTLNSNGTGDFRSMLLNSANNNTWAGDIVAAGTGLAQVSSAGGILTISGGVTSSGGGGTGTLFSRGAGTVIYDGVINLGTDRFFTRTDAGTVIVNSTGNSWVSTRVANGQIQIGANNALANVPFAFGEGNTNNGRLELNGFNQTVTSLSTFATSTGNNHIIRNSNPTSPSTLTFATPESTTDKLVNVQIQGTASGFGTLNLVKNGLGRTEFESGLVAANSWTVNDGTVAFTGVGNRVLPGSLTGASTATVEKAGASSLVATGTWNHAGTTNVTGGTLVLGVGTAGAINLSDTATLSTGLAGGALSSTAVTLGSAGATAYVPLLTIAGAPAPLDAASLTANGTVTVTPQAGVFSTGTYRLLDYDGTIGGAGSGAFALSGVATYPHMTAALDFTTAGQVNLVVSAVDSLIWTGQTSGAWDVDATANFALASAPSSGATFYQGDAVTFGDTHDVGGPATPVTNATITGGAVTIGDLTFNNSAVNYSVANTLSGAGSITKNGTGDLTLSGANTYSGITALNGGTLTLSGANALGGGAINVTAGTLKMGNVNALRGAGLVTVSSGATFDGNGSSPSTRGFELVVSGTGVGGNGAIVNNGADLVNNSHFAKITLAGDTTWGGSGRYDLVAGQILDGGSFTLTKAGTGSLWYNPSAGSILETVIVNGGVFGSQQPNSLSATAVVTVNSGGQHQIWNATAQQHNVVLNDGGILRQGNNAGGIINGQVTLNGSTADRNIQAAASGTLNIAGKITGTGGFTVNEAGAVQLRNAANDYAGDTVITLGTLNFDATGIIPATTNLIIDGGTFATGNLPRTVGSLSGAGGTISGGNVLTTNQASSTVWNGSLNGTTLQISGNGVLTLGGTVDNSAGTLVINSGTVIGAKGNTAAVTQAIHISGSNGVTMNGGIMQLAGTYDNTTPGTAINVPPAGINPATYGDLLYNNGPLNLNAGTFDLNGRQEAINGLANPAGAGGTVTNTAAATAAKLYVGHQNATSSFGGAINDGAGAATLAVEKIGTGTLTLTGTSNFTGGLTQTLGAIIVPSGAVLGNTPITVTANTFTFDGVHGTGAIGVNGSSVFAGAGTSGGTLAAATGTTVQVGPASGGTTATTLTLGGLTLSGGANLNLDFNEAGTVVDKVAATVSGGVTLNGVNNVNVALGAEGWVTGTYPIITYAGTVAGTGAAALNLATPVGHSTVTIADDSAGNISLQVVSAGDNKWVGGASSVWDINSSLNWTLAGNVFLNGDTAFFDDTATSFTPAIAANVTPAAVIFDNTTAYTLTGTGAFGITGSAGLTKMGAGTVTISSANTHTGPTDVQAGTLQVTRNVESSVHALGTGATEIAAGSTLVIDNLKTTAVTDTIPNTFTGSGLLKLQLAPGTTARGTSMSNVTGFNGTIQLSSLGATGDKWSIGGLGTLASSLVVDSGSTIFASGGSTTFTGGLTLNGGGNSEGRGALRVSGTTTIGGSISLASSSTISMENAAAQVTGNISSSTAGTHTLTLGGTGSTAGILSGNISDGTGTIAVTQAVGSYTLSGELSHSGGVTVNAGVLTLSNANNTYTGVTTLNTGEGRVLVVTANGVLGATGTGNETVVAGTAGANGPRLAFSGGVNYTAAEKVSGVGGGDNRGFIQASGTGNATFAGEVEVTGASRIGTQNGAQLTLTGVITQTTGNILFRTGDNAGDFVTLSNAGNSFGGDSTVFTAANGVGGNYAGVRLGVSNALPTGLTISGFSGTGGGTALDLNGKNQSLNGLINGAQLKIINLDTVTASTLTLNPTADKATTSTTILGGDGLGVIQLVKDGTFTQTLSGANTYTGTTTVANGTLALVGGSHASPITVDSGASLGFTLGSPTTSTSTFDLTNGTIKITGTPTLPSYTLISSSTGITGTPVLQTPIAGYVLKKVGNTLVLESPYEVWADDTGATGGPDGDGPDGDGIVNLLEYAFGTDPTVSSTGPLVHSGGVLTTPGQPILEEDGGVYYAVFGRRADYLDAGLTYTAEFSSALSAWTPTAVVPTVIATDGEIDVVRVPFLNLVPSDSGPQKPTFFRVEVSQ